MAYTILALLTLPFTTVFAFMLLIATGIFHERIEAEEVARNYAQSWKSATPVS